MSSARFRLRTRSGSGIGINIFNFNFNSSTSRKLQSNNHTRALSRASSLPSTYGIGTPHPPAPRKTLPASPRSRYNPPTPARPFTTTMASRTSSSSSKPEIPPLSNPSSSSSSGIDKGPLPIRPSSSVILLSPTNQVLLLHRVAKSTSFASAHVFPGGNLSEFHEGDYFPLPPTSDQELHRDSEAYRLAAVRETFEESGILLATRKDGKGSGMLELSEEELEEGRRKVFGDQVKFREWVEGRGGVADVENLIPFTRWITPQNQRKRFTTQMYLYMLPLHNTTTTTAGESPTSTVVVQTPTHDGGIEHTAAQFDSPSTWLAKASAGEIILYPPQFYLLTLISRFLPTKQSSNYGEQREKLVSFLRRVPTSSVPHPTSDIPWAEKVMSPEVVSFAKQGSYGNGRVILGLAKPGRELMDSGRGGDVERVVLVDFRKEEVVEVKEEQTEGGEVVKKVVKTTVRVPRDLEVMERAEAMAMAAAAAAPEKKKEKGSKL